MTLIDKIIQALEPIVIKNGQELIEASFEENANDKKLKVIVGSLNGPGIKELTSITKEFNKLNEANLIIPFDFSLDVSSPGLDRPLETMSDFKRNIDREVNIKFRDDKNEVQKITGSVKKIEDTEVIINVAQDNDIRVKIDNIIKAKLVIKIRKI